jgi:hypothetical protein
MSAKVIACGCRTSFSKRIISVLFWEALEHLISTYLLLQNRSLASLVAPGRTGISFIIIGVTNIIISLINHRWSRKLEALTGSSRNPIFVDSAAPPHHCLELSLRLVPQPQALPWGAEVSAIFTPHLGTWTLWKYLILGVLHLVFTQQLSGWFAQEVLASSNLTFSIFYARFVSILSLHAGSMQAYSLSFFSWRLHCLCWGLA